MEKSKIPSFLHQRVQPSTSTAGQKKTAPAISIKPLPARILTRRSNSCTDLRNLCNASTRPLQPSSSAFNLPKAKTKLILKTVPEKSSTVTKRAAPTTAPVVPAKIAKGQKIPPYDYKARYNFQVEKYANLQQTLRDTEASYNTNKTLYETLSQEKDNLSRSYELSQSELRKLRDAVSVIEKNHNEALQKLEESQKQLSELATAHSKLEATYHNVTRLCRSYTEDNEKLSLLNENLTKTNERLEHELSLLRQSSKNQEALINTLKTNTIEYESIRRFMHNQIQDLKGTIRVFCRVRPQLSCESTRSMCNFTYVDEDTLEIRKSKQSISTCNAKPTDGMLEFKFDKVFQPEMTQIEVFEELAQLIQSAMDGYHVCVFAYGQTGSGKTYTMQGEDDYESAGMIPRAVNLIFDLVTKYKEIGTSYTVQASFLEIYNESVHDLLNPTSRSPLEILFNEGRGTTVTNLTVKTVVNAKELSQLMLSANKNRAVAVTNYNEHSSRSHAVTKITLTGTQSETRAVYVGSVSLVDLAGSESAKTSSSDRIVETKNINKSLSALGTVMTALQKKSAHIPYRNSKLTYLLQSSLGGNSKTLMFVNITPFEECYNESVNALRFAAKVKEVKIASKKNRINLACV